MLIARSNTDDFNPIHRTGRAHELILQRLLDMGPMEFKALCWTAKLGPFSPPITFQAASEPG